MPENRYLSIFRLENLSLQSLRIDFTKTWPNIFNSNMSSCRDQKETRVASIDIYRLMEMEIGLL